MSIPWEAMGPDLESLVKEQSVRLVDALPISPLAPDKPRRGAFRLRFADGKLMKGRRLETSEQAEIAWRLTAHLGGVPTTRPIARRGDAWLEEWIAGTAVDSASGEFVEAGSLLGRIHAIESACPRGSRPLRNRWIEASLDVGALVEAGVLAADIAEAAVRLARAAVPTSAEWGLCHGDFCAENLLHAPAGRLCLIDNETVCELWLDYDLARAWYRWPMTAPSQLTAFLQGYETHRKPDDFLDSLPFWVVAVLVRAVQFRLRDGSPVDVPLARLEAFVACPGRWSAGQP